MSEKEQEILNSEAIETEKTVGNAAEAAAQTEQKEEKESAKGSHKKELKKAKEEAEKWQAESEENMRKWYAVTAEYENYRRRTQNQAASRYLDGRNDVVASFFPIGDNLERALLSCKDEGTKQGLEMVLNSYKKVLEGEGVEEINPLGQAFDPTYSEAIMAMPKEEGEESGVVKQVYVKGYKRGEKVLRYAQVIVTQ